MPFSVELGLLMALVTALMSVLGFFLKHRGAVAAPAVEPITIVQTVIAGGLVLVTVLADRVFGQPVTRRDWVGVGLTAFGLAFLAATIEGTAESAHSDYRA